MKKRRVRDFLLAGSLILGMMLTGCGMSGQQTEQNGEKEQNKVENEKISVVATIFPQYDFVRQIAGENVELKMLLKPGEETHSYEPTPQDIIAIQNSDLFIYVGGENDAWVEDILESMPDNGRKTLKLVNCVDTVEEEHVEGMKEERGHDHDEDEEHTHDEAADLQDTHENDGEIDEHIWTSPVNAQKLVKQVADDLGKVDPEHQKEYDKNADAYIKKLQKLDQKFKTVTEHAKDKYLAFADRFPLRYFVEEYGLDYTAAFAGCSSDTGPSADTITYLTRQVKERKLPVVLKIELTSDKVANAVAEAASTRDHKVKVETFYTCHNVTRQQFDAGETYASLMEKNLKVLKDALQ